jgi:hypothetical protein
MATPKTAREIYLTVVRHLIAQDKPATTGIQCRYRTKDGLKCAIGCLIPDDEYRRTMEDQGVRDMFEQHSHAEFVSKLSPHMNLLNSLQHIHDESRMWTDRAVLGTALFAVGIATGIIDCDDGYTISSAVRNRDLRLMEDVR